MTRAFVLSGGGSRGAYEIGVWKALDELGLKFDIVTGTSVGAINGAMIVQQDLELAASLWEELQTSMIFDLERDDALSYAKEILAHGGATTDGLKNMLTKYIHEDVIRASNIDYGLVTVELAKHNTLHKHEFMKADIPQDHMIPYIMASAACFPAVKGQEIGDVTYIDGGYADNLPISLAIRHGATEIIAINLNAVGIIDKKTLKETADLTLIESRWDLGNFLVFDKSNSERSLHLGYLETMKLYGHYEGAKYIFEKETYDRIRMRGSDEAGSIFGIAPDKAYTPILFNRELSRLVSPYQAEPAQKFSLNLAKQLSRKALVLAIAHELQNNSSVILSKPGLTLFKEEILAANYLLKAGIVSSN